MGVGGVTEVGGRPLAVDGKAAPRGLIDWDWRITASFQMGYKSWNDIAARSTWIFSFSSSANRLRKTSVTA